MNDKDKSVISKLVDTVTNAVGGAVKAAVMPTVDPEEEVVAEKSYEQMLVGDAATAPEAVPAPTAQKKGGATKSNAPPFPKKLTKQVAQPAKASAKKSKKIASKKSAKKTSKKTARKTQANKKAKKSKR
jgi:hypothetical protein